MPSPSAARAAAAELCAKDLDFVRSAEAKEKQAVAKDRSSKLSATFIDTFAKMIDGLENGLPVRDMELTNEEVRGGPSIQCHHAVRL